MIALACDHAGFYLMGAVKSYLDASGFMYKDFGTYSEESCDYPEMAASASRAVSSGECNTGILICGTGIGMTIAANKIPGVRAALCTDHFTAEMARIHNNANVLALGSRVTDEKLALGIVELFLTTVFNDVSGRHSRRIKMLDALDDARRGGEAPIKDSNK